MMRATTGAMMMTARPKLTRSGPAAPYVVDLEPFGIIGQVFPSPRRSGGWRAVNAFMDRRADRKLRAAAVQWLVEEANSRASDYR